MRNQLHDVPTADGKPDENRYYNCVPTSLAACIQWLDGIVVGADKLKDLVYGQGHVGGGDELRYGPLLSQSPYDLKLSVEYLPSASQQIIDAIRACLRAQIPSIITMHSQWSRPWTGDPNDGYHVGVPFSIDESDSGLLHIMNPWGGFDHVQPISWWRARLGIGVYPVAKATAALPKGYTWDAARGTLTFGNGVTIDRGIAAKIHADLLAGTWQAGYADKPEQTIKDAEGDLAFVPCGSAVIIWRPGWAEPRYATDAEMSTLISEGAYKPAA